MSNFYPGPPYFFICLKCGYRFAMEKRKLILRCPRCKSFLVVEDKSVRK